MEEAGRLQLGKISSIEAEVDENENPTMAKVVPVMATDMVTAPLVIPWYLRGDMGELEPETDVVFVQFENQSGMILQRADGEWPGVVVGDVSLAGALEVEGALNAEDFGTEEVPSFNEHVHTDVTAGGEDTGKPK